MRPFLALLALSIAIHLPVRAENLPANHPAVDVAQKYMHLVAEQNWAEAVKLVRPASIERKKRETIAIIKAAPTMTQESAMLARLGVKSLKELEDLSVEQFYIHDRVSFYDNSITPEVLKEKRESLKITILGVVGEGDGKTVHVVVRTSQVVMKQRLSELFFLSFVQDEKDTTKWLMTPDVQRPITESIDDAKPADGAAAPDAAAKPAAAPPAPAGAAKEGSK